MKNLLLAAALVAGGAILAGGFQRIRGQEATPSGRVPIGAVAAQAVGRVVLTPDGGADIFGYYTFVEGIPGLFKDAPSAAGAHLTYRAEPTAAAFLDNGRVLHLIATPANGQFTRIGVYYHPEPTNDLERPASFAEGTHVASYRTHGTRANVTSNAYQLSATLELEWAVDFPHAGRTFNLRNAAESLTLQTFGPGASLDGLIEQAARDGRVTVEYGGTAYAAGAYPAAGQ
ncbi:MAG: hypothetical protein R2729_20090 [Bryobacteraceae bacterium]